MSTIHLDDGDFVTRLDLGEGVRVQGLAAALAAWIALNRNAIQSGALTRLAFDIAPTGESFVAEMTLRYARQQT